MHLLSNLCLQWPGLSRVDFDDQFYLDAHVPGNLFPGSEMGVDAEVPTHEGNLQVPQHLIHQDPKCSPMG
jgi:hypothetical protein